MRRYQGATVAVMQAGADIVARELGAASDGDCIPAECKFDFSSLPDVIELLVGLDSAAASAFADACIGGVSELEPSTADCS